MSTYTDELTAEIERVTLKGNADKATIRKLASIIFRMDNRLQQLEGVEVGTVAVEAPVELEIQQTGPAIKQVDEKKILPVGSKKAGLKTSASKSKD